MRILVPYSRTHFFLDGADERGIIAELGRELEREINRKEGLRTRLVRVVFIPVSYNQLIPELMAGQGDIATGGLMVSESRKALVDFSDPVLRNSKDIVVTGPGASTIRAVEDLAGKEIYVQPSSHYHQALTSLNETFKNKGSQALFLYRGRQARLSKSGPEWQQKR